MQPITHAKIKYWSITATYIVPAIYIAAAGSFWTLMQNRGWFADIAESRIEELHETILAMIEERKYETERVFRFHKLGYELRIVPKYR